MSKETLTLRVRDVSEQQEFIARDLDPQASWGETLKRIVAGLDLPPNTPAEANAWTGRLEREGRHLHPSEILGEALEDLDEVVLQPEVVAG